MQIKTTVDGDKATIALTGKLTVHTSSELSAVVDGLDSSVRNLVIDLSGVDYIASAGLRVLVSTNKTVRQRGGSVSLAHPTEDMLEVLEMTGHLDVFSVER